MEKAELVLKTREEVGKAAGEVAAKRVEQKGLEAEQATAVAAAQKPFAAKLVTLKESIAEREAAIRAWCEKNEHEFVGTSTLDFARASVQWKPGGYSVEILEGWTDKTVIGAMREWLVPKLFAALEEVFSRAFLRVKVELNRNAIKEAREKFEEKVWAKRGIAIVQGRSLIVEGKA